MARKMLRGGKAAIWRRFPFTVILEAAIEETSVPTLRIKLDPGSKTTGIALVDDERQRVVFAAELEHRGERIKADLASRRAIRRNRRGRKTRYRQSRFDNRTRPEGWLAPSLMSRVRNVETWVRRFRKLALVDAMSLELARFDTQIMDNPDISGVQHQQGTLMGYEVRESLLEKYNRTCIYCGGKNTPLEIDHIWPKSRGGSDRVANLVISCRPCNHAQARLRTGLRYQRIDSHHGTPRQSRALRQAVKQSWEVGTVRSAQNRWK